jgi:hypothetical protein
VWEEPKQVAHAPLQPVAHESVEVEGFQSP